MSTKDADWNEPHGYHSRKTVPFGKDLHLPEPFDCTVDTSAF
ncbi:hypothetical protein ACFYYB_38555 [Streptomyces sp. NPDC002886]